MRVGAPELALQFLLKISLVNLRVKKLRRVARQLAMQDHAQLRRSEEDLPRFYTLIVAKRSQAH
jgi:hypothetical protein